MSLKPLVSAIVPCFNAAPFLRGTIRSILEQGLSATEILIIDDLSTDDSVRVAETLSREDRRLTLLRHAVNQGAGAARNTGLHHARGQFVCFLDADDAYAPGFFQSALAILERDPLLAAVQTGLELVDLKREIHPLQYQSIVASVASNVMVRKAVAELLGGFPEHAAFRGKVAGEDAAFKRALVRWFTVRHVEAPFCRYRVHPGSHVHYFLDRSRVVNNQLTFTSVSEEQRDGSLDAANEDYLAQAQARIAALGLVKPQAADCFVSHGRRIQETRVYEQLRQDHEAVQGFLHPLEGYALFLCAEEGPGQGAIVEIGSLMGRSTCWLAAGTRKAGREKVIAVDHFRGSPEHQANASHPIAAVVEQGTTLPQFLANLEQRGLQDWVIPRVGASLEVGQTWQGPIRLLFIDGDHSYEASRQDVETWIPYVIPGGIVGFHDVDGWPGVTRLYRELLTLNPDWKEVVKAGSLRLVQSPTEGRRILYLPPP